MDVTAPTINPSLVAISGNVIDFSAVAMGAESRKTVQLKNTSSDTLNVSTALYVYYSYNFISF